MPLYKRKPFETIPPPKDLNPEEHVFFCRVTNEIFTDYNEYFERVILCNSLVWACSLTGRTGLTYEEAIESEKDAKRILTGFPKSLKKAILYLTNHTFRGRILDVCEDVIAFAREHYFLGDEVMAVIGNLWCRARVTRVIPPTPADIDNYRKEQEEKGTLDKDDYLRDDSWGPPPDLYRYEVEETDPDNPDTDERYILDAIDVRREKTILTKDKMKFLLKLSTEYNEEARVWRVKSDIWKGLHLDTLKYEDIFTGECPKFETSLGPLPSKKSKSKSEPNAKKSPTVSPGSKENKKTSSSTIPNGPSTAAGGKKSKSTGPAESKPKKPKTPKKLSPEELKQLENERKIKEREEQKVKKRMVVDFKKLWFKPKEDLEVEDLNDLPSPDPVYCKIPNQLFGTFMMILEFFNCYSGTLKVRDSFPSGLGFEGLERALTKVEVAGPLSDILQLLLRGLFRLQETENAETLQDEKAAVGLDIDDSNDDITAALAIQQATAAASWSLQYQNTPLHKLPLDHLSLTEVLRLHLLSSGSEPSDKDVKWRFQMRGGYTSRDDPGLQIRLEEPQILKTLASGTIFDLTLYEKMKVIECLINQILSYVPIRDVIDESFEEFKQARMSLRSVQAAEKRKETEDHVWRQKLKADRLVPDENFMIKGTGPDGTNDEVQIINPTNNKKPHELLTDRQIEILLEKRDRETARRKQNYEYEVSKLMETINKSERKLGLHPIGRDRAYRRYWLFASVAGLFVEQDDENVGICGSATGTPWIPNVDVEDLDFINAHFEKLKMAEQDNSNSTTLLKPKKINPKKKSISLDAAAAAAPARPSTFGICTGNPDSCPVHSLLLPHTKWSFYWNTEQLESLISGLTPRGIREKDLKTYLTDERSGIESILLKCPITKLNTDTKYPENVISAAERKPQKAFKGSSNLDPNLNFPAGTPIDTILDLQLRDLILEFEEKICLGVLGSLKVNDRAAWRKAIENRGYDKQTGRLHWGSKRKLLLPAEPQPSTSTAKTEDDTSSVSSSRSSKDPESTNPLIKDLASAILQLEQSLEPKFMKRPLGAEKEDDKKKRSKSSGSSGGGGGGDGDGTGSSSHIESPIERWETSLMNSTSFSQLFMHLFTLDNSVEWNRSVLNARCRVCRRKGDGENMLLCENCNKGHHLYCLRPPLEKIPRESWYCFDCKPPELEPRLTKQNRKTFVEIEEDDDEDGSDENEDDKNEEDDGGDGTDDDNFGGPPRLEQIQELCEVCRSDGEVICCDSCPRVYHLECLDPPKTRVPRGDWYCDYCTNSNKQKKTSSSGSKKGKSKSAKKSKKTKKPVKKHRRVIYSDSDDDDEEEEEDESETETSPEDTTAGESGDENSAEEEPEPVVKVKFPRSPRKRSSPGYVTLSEEEEEEAQDHQDHDESSGSRGGRRSAAAKAAIKISQAAKRLRSDSKENETSDYSNDSTSNSSGGGFNNNNHTHSRKRSHEESPGDGDSSDQPKRTRLQRMNTNRCGDSGDLDNVLLDKLIVDVMKQPDAWPFLKPVTRAEAPDYHDIVKNPMDLGTIKYKLNSMVYTCNQEFLADLQLIFDNCFIYNPADNSIYKAGEKLQSYCERRCSKSGLHFSGSE